MTRALMVLVVMTNGLAHADDDGPARLVEKVFGTSDGGVRPPYDSKAAHAVKFDEKSLEVIRRAKTIELIRLKNDERFEGRTAPGDGGVDSLSRYAVERRFVLTDSQAVARFKTLTLNPRAYRWYEGIKFCGGFQPKVVLRFGEGELESVDVLLSFNCDDIAVRSYGKTNIGPLNEQFADMMSDDWLRLVKAALPDDEFIQKEQRLSKRLEEPKREPPPWTPDGGSL